MNKISNVSKINKMSKKNIIIIGPFCSGTNLIENIFLTNKFNHNINVLKNCSVYWKHTLDTDLLLKTVGPDSIIVIMYRNIYNWIVSICKMKYNLKFDKINDKINFVSSPNDKIISKFHPANITFNNIVDVYNAYYKKYFDLKSKYASNVIIVNYDELISDNGFEYLNSKLNNSELEILSKELFIKQLNKPSKKHGHCVKNNQEALKYILHDNLAGKKLVESNNLKSFVDLDLINFFEQF